MSERKIVVPEGMIEAVVLATTFGQPLIGDSHRAESRRILTAALRWLSDYPILPTKAQIDEMVALWSNPDNNYKTYDSACIDIAVQWQRRMFLAPDPDESIKDLLYRGPGVAEYSANRINDRIRNAYERGKESKRGREYESPLQGGLPRSEESK